MRWSIIRLIWLREMRDQLRDRRTLFMIAGLPLLLYPVLGAAVLSFAIGFAQKPSVVGVVAGPDECFPPRYPPEAGRSPVPRAAWLAATPRPGVGTFGLLEACALAQASELQLDYPCLVESGAFTTFRSIAAPRQARAWAANARLKLVFLDAYDPDWLAQHKGDLVLAAPRDFFAQLERGEEAFEPRRPQITVHGRPRDEASRQALHRLKPLLETWTHDLRRVRLARKGLSERFTEPVEFREPEFGRALGAEDVFDLMPRLFPFMLVMWSLAGALYPAVDVCAGEKERGTMETLLITPAGREEIVLGKFLTIWVFSAGTALLNLASMGLTTWYFAGQLPGGGLPLSAIAWCVLLALPQAALFSAVSLAIGAYARSSKEGQYYLMPLFLLTMPLIFLTLAPGVELNAFYALVPVTGVALLMQKLMTAQTMANVPWIYFAPVLAPIAIYSWLALRWAIEQFQREEVLFREAERWDWKLWLRRLFREKEVLPTAAQAFFCFGVLFFLRWFSLGLGRRWPLEVYAAITALAFTATPPLFMALLLNTMPREALYLRRPRWRDVGLAVVLAVLLLPPLAGLAYAAEAWFPQPTADRHPLVQILRALHDESILTPEGILLELLCLALLPAICEELAFRGFILSGLHRRFRPRNAVLLSSFLFALFHLNVFLFLPAFVLGVVLGLLTVRSRSVVPAVLFHFLYNAFLIGSVLLGRQADEAIPAPLRQLWPGIAGGCLLVALALVWWLYRKPYDDLRRARRATSRT
jgi:sodium transport system permease protein